MCSQSIGLLAGVLEAGGRSTVCLALLRHVAEVVRIPRTLAVPFPFGSPLDGQGRELRRAAVDQALGLLLGPGPKPVLDTAQA